MTEETMEPITEETPAREAEADGNPAAACPAEEATAEPATAGADETGTLREELRRARERVTQLERERSLLSQGVPEEDLDYCVFKIGKLVSAEKDFDTAAKEFLQQRGSAHRSAQTRSTGASLADRRSPPKTTNDVMNRLLRGI